MLKSMLILLILTNLLSCKETEEELDTSVATAINDFKDKKNDNSNEDSVINHLPNKIYSFNLKTGKCLDSDGEEGLNTDYFGECGDFIESDLADKDLKQNIFWGANFSGAYLDKSQFSLDDLTYVEAKLDQNTRFDFEEDLSKKKLIKSQRNAIKTTKKWFSKIKAETKKDQKAYKKVKKKLRRMASSPEKDALIEEALDLKDDIKEGNELKSDIAKKSKRHKSKIKKIKKWD